MLSVLCWFAQSISQPQPAARKAQQARGTRQVLGNGSNNLRLRSGNMEQLALRKREHWTGQFAASKMEKGEEVVGLTRDGIWEQGGPKGERRPLRPLKAWAWHGAPQRTEGRSKGK